MYHLLANMPPSPAFLPTEPTPLDQLNGAASAEVVRIITKAMARDRDARYQSAKEMKEDLLTCLPGYVSPIQSRAAAGQPQQATTATPPKARPSSTLVQDTPAAARTAAGTLTR